MAIYNFGYAANAIRSSNDMYVARDIGPVDPTSRNMLGLINGDVVKAQIASAVIFGNTFDFLWGVNLWSSKTYKVVK